MVLTGLQSPLNCSLPVLPVTLPSFFNACICCFIFFKLSYTWTPLSFSTTLKGRLSYGELRFAGVQGWGRQVVDLKFHSWQVETNSSHTFGLWTLNSYILETQWHEHRASGGEQWDTAAGVTLIIVHDRSGSAVTCLVWLLQSDSRQGGTRQNQLGRSVLAGNTPPPSGGLRARLLLTFCLLPHASSISTVSRFPSSSSSWLTPGNSLWGHHSQERKS